MSWLVIACLKNAVLVLPLALLALAVARCWRRPALAHVLWVLVLVKLVTPPLVDVPVGWSWEPERWLVHQVPVLREVTATPAPISVTKSDAPVQQKTNLSQPLAASSRIAEPVDASPPPATHAAWLPRSFTLMTVLNGVWLLGCILVGTTLAWRAWRFQRFLALAASTDHRLSGRVAQLAYAAGLKTHPRVIVVEGVLSPMLWGLGRSVQLVFPARLAERLKPAELDALLLHELAHYARGDYWVRLLELAAHVYYWWNPVVWWTCREIEAAEEQCCDAWVVNHQNGTRLAYAEALLSTIDFLCEPPVRNRGAFAPASCGLGEVPLLKTRLEQIMRGELAGQLPRWAWVTVLGFGLLVSPLKPAVFAKVDRPGRPQTSPIAQQFDAGGIATIVSPQLISSSAALVVDEPAIDDLPQAPSSEPKSLPAELWWTAVSPDGHFQLEARTGYAATLVHVLAGFRLDLSNHRILRASFAPDSKTFATGHDDGSLRLWDSQTGGLIATLPAHAARITSVAWSPDGQHVASGSADGVVTMWSVAALEEVARLSNPSRSVSCVRWSRGGDRVVVALGSWNGQDTAELLVWSPTDGATLARQSLAQPAGAVAWLSDDLLLVAGWDGQAQVRTIADELPVQSITVDKNAVSASAWSPDCPLVSPWLAEQLAAGTAR